MGNSHLVNYSAVYGVLVVSNMRLLPDWLNILTNQAQLPRSWIFY